VNAVPESVCERTAASRPASSVPERAAEQRSTAPAKDPIATDRGLHWPIVWTLVVLALITWGRNAHLERYITPDRGVGYWLGITGGSMMLLLLIYSARKRARWLRWLGGIPAWFRIHMVLGVSGPVLVLFHANFRLGATNSNVALISMLLVAGSGVVGRYIYTRMHARLDGRQDSLEELQAVAAEIRAQTTHLAFLPGVLDAIDRAEQRLVNPPTGRVGRFLHVFTAGGRAALARWRLHRVIKRAVSRAASHESASIAIHAHRIGATVQSYADRRLDAARRVAEYRLFARLFSFWHVLHIPLFFTLLFAAIAHVVAVNLY